VRPVSDPGANPASRPRALAATYFPRATTFEAASPVSVDTRKRREQVDIRMIDGVSYCMDVTSMRGGMAAPAYVSVTEAEVFALAGSDAQLTSGYSGSDGRIKVCDLPPGRYNVSAATLVSDWFSGTADATVRDRDLTDVVVTPTGAVTVEGEIAWAGDGSNDRVGPSVRIKTDPNLLGLRWQELAGRFTAQFQPNTPYTVQVGTNGPGYVRDITYSGASVLHRSLVVAPGSSGPLRVVIGRDGGYVRAHVRRADGEVAANRWVFLLSEEAAHESELAAGVVAGLTDEQGVCMLQGLRPGRYRVIAADIGPPAIIPLPGETPSIDRTPETLQQLLRARASGTALELQPNARVDINVISRRRVGG
jgi:hypothetical protein